MESLLTDRFPELAKDPALLDQLRHHARRVSLPQAHPICHEGADCRQLALVLSGTARVYKIGETGREITLYRLGPGECCILTLSCIIGDRPFPAHAVTETAMEALVIPAGQIQRWMDELTTWRHYAWRLVANRLGEIISLVEEITFQRMDKRLELYLGRSARFPLGQAVSITHQRIATELGTSREVVSRLLKDLEQRGFVELGRGWLRLRRPLPDQTAAKAHGNLQRSSDPP